MRRSFTALMVLLAFAASAEAVNTPAGTAITITTTVDYDINGIGQPAAVSVTTFLVDNKVNLVVTRIADATSVPGATNQAIPFTVTNLGNGAQRYALSIVSRVTDSFDMNNVRIYRDSGTVSGLWDAGDALYADAGTFGDIASGATLTVLVVGDTPAAQTNGETAVYDLIAATVDAGTTILTVQTAGPDTAGIDEVFVEPAGSAAGDGAREGRHSAFGTVTIADVGVLVNKSVTIMDQFGGAQPLPGATLRYTITVSVSGAGTANGVVITDPIPADTTYVAGTLRLNSAGLTDNADGDAGELAGAPGTVTVRLGPLSNASPLQTIVFDVRIN